MVRLKITEEPIIKLKVNDEVVKLKTDVTYESAHPFTGSYEYTPTDETQTISIGGKRATSNIVINPIPNNYGKVTWNGTYLTVE